MATVEKLPSGSYRARGYAYVDGRRVARSFTERTRREALSLALEFEQMHPRGTSSVTVKECMRKHIDLRKAVLSPSTIRGYEKILELHFKGIQNVPVSSLTAERVQQEINLLAEKHSPKTVRNIYGFLTASLLSSGESVDLRQVKLPQKSAVEMHIPSDNDIRLMLRKSEGTRIHPCILLAAFGGLRRSEISALLPEDIDLKSNTVRISKAIVRGDDENWHKKAPKSVSGTRIVPYPPGVLKTVTAAKAPESDTVTGMTPAAITCAFERLMCRLHMGFRFHDLRHYTASVLLALNVPDKYAMEIMGHATSSTLKQIYQHTMDEKRREVAKKMTSYFSSFPSK